MGKENFNPDIEKLLNLAREEAYTQGTQDTINFVIRVLQQPDITLEEVKKEVFSYEPQPRSNEIISGDPFVPHGGQ